MRKKHWQKVEKYKKGSEKLGYFSLPPLVIDGSNCKSSTFLVVPQNFLCPAQEV
jgi:hypothetical protein